MTSVMIGIILGLGVGVVNFKLLLWMASRLAHMESSKAGVFTAMGFIVRTALYVGLVAASIYSKQIHVFGVVVGLLAASFLNLRDRNKRID